MKLATIEMPQEEAQKAFTEYRRAVRSAKTAQVNSEDAQIARCYKALMKGHPVIDLNGVMGQAGEDGNGLPRLAIARADTTLLEMNRNWMTGAVHMFSHELRFRYWQAPFAGQKFTLSLSVRKGRITAPHSWQRGVREVVRDFSAIVPNIPPALRPPHNLSNYHLLWEPKWAVSRAVPPGDPALLKHLGGPLYAVLATWDLTPVEQAVLGVTRN